LEYRRRRSKKVFLFGMERCDAEVRKTRWGLD